MRVTLNRQPETNQKLLNPQKAKKQKKPDSPAKDTTAGAREISIDRLEEFKSDLYIVFGHQQSMEMDNVRKWIVGEKGFTEGEMIAAIDKMSDDNKLMLAANVLYLI